MIFLFARPRRTSFRSMRKVVVPLLQKRKRHEHSLTFECLWMSRTASRLAEVLSDSDITLCFGAPTVDAVLPERVR